MTAYDPTLIHERLLAAVRPAVCHPLATPYGYRYAQGYGYYGYHHHYYHHRYYAYYPRHHHRRHWYRY
jgi:hypothetical protein